MDELNSINISKLQHGTYKINLSKYKSKIVFKNIFQRFDIKYNDITDYIILDKSNINNISKQQFKVCNYPEVSTKVLMYLGNLAIKYRSSKINISLYDMNEMINTLKELGYNIERNVTNQNYIIIDNASNYGVQVNKHIFRTHPFKSVSAYNIITTKRNVITKKDLKRFLNGKIIKCVSNKARTRMFEIIKKLGYKFVKHDNSFNYYTFCFHDNIVEHDYPQLPIIAYETISFYYIDNIKIL